MRLEDLHNTPTVADDTADADAYARQFLGVAVAQQITWRAQDWLVFGVLELDDARVELRYEAQDPTQETLDVRVPCPHSERCQGPAWVPVSTVDELVKAVEGTSVDVPWCERCDEE